MILALDVGNSQIFAGVYDGDQLKLTFRRNSKGGASSDEYGVFLRAALRENGVDPGAIQQIAICSVVPDVVHSLKNCCRKYFNITPFILQPGVKTGLQIKYRNPLEVGADRIANVIAASHLYPGRNLIVIDYGTATTFDVGTANKEYLGGAIIPGLRISMEALESRTARLPSVEILAPQEAVGKSTVESIQSGLYYSNIGATRELVERITREAFRGEKPVVIGTGGFASLFENARIFDAEIPDLVLKGMFLALKMNV